MNQAISDTETEAEHAPQSCVCVDVSPSSDKRGSKQQRRKHLRQAADPVDEQSVRKHQRPRRVAGTLFLDPHTPEEEWAKEIDAGRYLEIYVPISDTEFTERLDFACSLRDRVLTKFAMADPVVIGPVTGPIARKWQDQIDESNLRVTDLDQDAYISMSRSAHRFRARGKTSSKHTR